MSAIASISPPGALSGDPMYEVILADWLKGTIWKAWAGQMVFYANFQFSRDHRAPMWGRWEFRGPNIVYLRAAPGDPSSERHEKFELVDLQLRSCLKSGGLIYSLVDR